MFTNRERGDNFDSWVMTQLAEYLPSLRRTIGSGSVFGDQDQVCDEFRISVKLKSGRGLTLKELREPYGIEAVNRLRVPLTVLRVDDYRADDDWQRTEYAIVDGRLILLYGKELVRLCLQDLDFEIIEDWPAGASLSLLEGCRPRRFLIMMRFPSTATHALILRLDDFLDVLATLTQLLDEQKLLATDLKEEEM